MKEKKITHLPKKKKKKKGKEKEGRKREKRTAALEIGYLKLAVYILLNYIMKEKR